MRLRWLAAFLVFLEVALFFGFWGNASNYDCGGDCGIEGTILALLWLFVVPGLLLVVIGWGSVRWWLRSGPSRKRMAARIALGVVVALVVAVGGVYLMPAFGSVSSDALLHSVTREVDGGYPIGIEDCRERRPARWSCRIGDSQDSATIPYRVSMRGRRCWLARTSHGNIAPGHTLPAEVEGCVGLRDQLRLFRRLH